MLVRPSTDLERQVDHIKAATARFSMSAIGYTPRTELTLKYLNELIDLAVEAKKLL